MDPHMIHIHASSLKACASMKCSATRVGDHSWFVKKRDSGVNCPGIVAEQGRLSVGNCKLWGQDDTHHLKRLPCPKALAPGPEQEIFLQQNNTHTHWPFLGITPKFPRCMKLTQQHRPVYSQYMDQIRSWL